MLAGPSITELSMQGNRIRAVFLATNLLDDTQIRDFFRLIENEAPMRVGLSELIQETGIDATSSHVVDQFDFIDVEWLVLVTAAFAAKAGYPLDALDPSSPPTLNTPAGLMLQKVSQFIRRQADRTATERDRLAKKLAYTGPAAVPAAAASADGDPQTPLPEYYRPPVPETYSEFNPDLALSEDEVPVDAEAHAVDDGRLRITEADLEPQPNVTRMPPIKITEDQLKPKRKTTTRQEIVSIGPSTIDQLTSAISNLFNSEPLGTTRLKVQVQESPDGPGVYGLQVRVTCKGIRSHVAGTTDRNGRFTCELPVRQSTGLTYDVDLSWPEELGGEIERKSITMSADRPEFELPFYKRLH